MEVNRTEPSHSVSLPWNEIHKSLREVKNMREGERVLEREREKERERKREREREKPESEIDNGKLCKVVWA
jgi:hypothetical protein